MLAAMLALVLIPAQAAPGDDLPIQVRRLVSQLDAPQLRERDRAEAELLALGPKVLPLLPKDPSLLPPEQARRLARVRARLQQESAESSLEPSTVTLRGKMPVGKVLAAIEEQTGNRLIPADATNEIAADFDKTPFWKALDAALDRAHLGMYPYGDDGGLRIVGLAGLRPSRAARADYRGPFRFEPIQILARRDFRAGGGQLEVNVEIAWEPRLSPITLRQKLAEVEAVDENGARLTVAGPFADLEIPVEPGRTAKQVSLPFALPPRTARQIARLSGTIGVLVPGKAETFRFDNLAAKEQTRRIATTTVVLEEVRKGAAGIEVHFRVRFDAAAGALASHRNWILDNPGWLEDRAGKRVVRSAVETTRQTADEVGLVYTFPAEGPIESFAFVYRTATVIFSTPVKYELRAIELP